MKIKQLVTVIFCAGGMVTNSVAEDNMPDGDWKGDLELGIVNTTGNTKTEVTNIKSKAEVRQGKWLHFASFNALTASDRGNKTAEKYLLSGKIDYNFNQHDYFFGSVNYENDRFSGYEYRINEVFGYGRRVIDESVLTLGLEIGLGARQSKLDKGASDDEFIIHGGAILEWNVSKTSVFTEKLDIDVGENSTISTSVTALTAQINGSLATKITYTIKNTSDVPDGVENTDTETAVTLVYSF